MGYSCRIFVQHLLQLTTTRFEAAQFLALSVQRFSEVFLDLLLIQYKILRFRKVLSKLVYELLIDEIV